MELNKQIKNYAFEIKDQIVNDRRFLHSHAESGVSLPTTEKYIIDRLTFLGYEPKKICDGGITATIQGNPNGKVILLRADMDALKINEKTDLPFKCENGCMHACGHDFHASMLLGCAAILKKFSDKINGTVKLVFQSDEEGFTGAKRCLAAGVLKNPKPDAAIAMHVHSGTPSGFVIAGRGTTMAGCTLFRVTVKGVGCHGAMPETGIDPIQIAAHIYSALQGIVAREISALSPVALTIGKFNAGTQPNIIPEFATLEGTIRTFDRDLTSKIMKRIDEISTNIATAFGGSATTEEISSAPPLKNDVDFVNTVSGYVRELNGENSVYNMDTGGMGSEDFASYTYELPCAYLLIGAGAKNENELYGKPMHNESVIFNEDILPIGAAIESYSAIRWLQG